MESVAGSAELLDVAGANVEIEDIAESLVLVSVDNAGDVVGVAVYADVLGTVNKVADDADAGNTVDNVLVAADAVVVNGVVVSIFLVVITVVSATVVVLPGVTGVIRVVFTDNSIVVVGT